MQFTIHRQNAESGQSLFELVIAIAVSAVVIIAIVSLATNAIRNATYSRNSSVAISLADDAIEWLRTQRDSDINIFLTNTQTPIWCFSTLNWNSSGACSSTNVVNNIYTRKATFSIDTSGKTIIHVKVDVSWTDSQGTHDVTNYTDFADWRQR